MELKCVLESLACPTSSCKISSSSCFKSLSGVSSNLLQQDEKQSVYSIRDPYLYSTHLYRLYINPGLNHLYTLVMMVKAHWRAVNFYSWVTVRSSDMWSTCLEKRVGEECDCSGHSAALVTQRYSHSAAPITTHHFLANLLCIRQHNVHYK